MEQRKRGLDYMRAAAILFVMIAHSFLFGGHDKHPLTTLGFLGVEIFFVLSGYLIGGILLASITLNGNAISWSIVCRFWIRRWLRTVPNYFLFLPLYVILQRYGVKYELLLYLVFAQNLAWPISGNDLFAVSWSLAVEEWFYLILPLLTLGLFWMCKRMRPAFLATVCMMFFAPLFLRLIFGTGRSWDSMRTIVVFRLDALMWGVGLAAAQRYRPQVFRRLCHPAFLILGLSGMPMVCVWVWFRSPGSSTQPADAFIFTAASLCCALVLPFLTHRNFKNSVVNIAAYYTSVWSYSLYLCHIICLHVADLISRKAALPDWATVAIFWIGSFAAAAAIYHGFERPILRWRDRLTRARPGPGPMEFAAPG